MPEDPIPEIVLRALEQFSIDHYATIYFLARKRHGANDWITYHGDMDIDENNSLHLNFWGVGESHQFARPDIKMVTSWSQDSFRVKVVNDEEDYEIFPLQREIMIQIYHTLSNLFKVTEE